MNKISPTIFAISNSKAQHVQNILTTIFHLPQFPLFPNHTLFTVKNPKFSNRFTYFPAPNLDNKIPMSIDILHSFSNFKLLRSFRTSGELFDQFPHFCNEIPQSRLFRQIYLLLPHFLANSDHSKLKSHFQQFL